ncbi:Fic/DOC family protein [Nocardia sp. NPDC058640]|uniref:Fic/DOC family protein n=1 Tax=Nocardia sp. NPDC058640 TaxID=3346571 RepID=UPI0036626633
MTVDPYLDPESGVFRNRLGIADAAALHQAESDLSQAALVDLGVRTLPGRYDLPHLCAFHREIFGDVYPWAGEVRTVGIAKSDPFCLPHHIVSYAAEVFAGLTADGHLRGLNRSEFVTKLAHYLGEVNAIHPFREGNGRAQRAFFHQLGREVGWVVDWSDLDPDENVRVSMASLRGDNGPMRDMLDRLVHEV